MPRRTRVLESGVIHGGDAVAELKLMSITDALYRCAASSTAATLWPN